MEASEPLFILSNLIEIWKIFGTIITAAIIPMIIFIVSDRRSAFERVQSIIKEASTGEAAELRHRIAKYYIDRFPEDSQLIASKAKGKNNKKKYKYSDSDATRDSFKIIWLLLRVRAVDRSLNPFLHRKPLKLLRESLRSFIAWHLGEQGGKIIRGDESIDSVLVKIDKNLKLNSGDLENLKTWASEVANRTK